MKEKMYRMNFGKDEFNALMQYLDLLENERLSHKIQSYSTVIEETDGNQYISIRFFGDELQRLCWLLMLNLPEEISEDRFTPLVEVIKEREAAYKIRVEEERCALYAGIKQALLENPKVTGSEIARNLGVSKDKVYAIWNDVRTDIEKEA